MPTADRGKTVSASVWGVALACVASVLLPCCVGAPQRESGSRETPADQMGIAVSGMGGARTALTLTYPSDPGRQKAAEDADILANSGGWTVAEPRRTEENGSVYYEAEMTPAVTLDSTGSIPLFPFVHAFRRFPEVVLVFVGMSSGPEGDFTGSNRFLSATWHRSGTVTSYQVYIHDDSFSRPEDVALTESPLSQEPRPSPTRRTDAGRPVWVLWLLLVLGSVGMGVFVWGMTWWGMSLTGSRSQKQKEDKALPVAKENMAVGESSSENQELGPMSGV